MFQYNLFQQIPQEIVQQCQAVKDSPLNQSLFQKIYWLISLKEFPQTALSFLHFSQKLSENIFSEQQLIDEVEYIQNFALPKNSIISGFIVFQEEFNSDLQGQTIQFRKNLIKIQQQYKDSFSNDLINIFINEDFKFTSKDWRENLIIQFIDDDIKDRKMQIQLSKYQDVSDILKQYIQFGFYYQYQYDDQQNNIDIQQILKQQIKMIQKILLDINNTYQGDQDLLLLELDENLKFRENVLAEIEENDEQQQGKGQDKNIKQKGGKKDKKSKNNNQKAKNKDNQKKSNKQVLYQIIQKHQERMIKQASDLQKQCPSFIKNTPLQFDIISQIQKSEFENIYQQNNSINEICMKDQKLISIDSLSYYKITDINEDNCLELLQNSFDMFLEKMQLVADYQNINNKNKIQTNFFSFNHQPINLGCFNSEIFVQELHRFYHLKPIHNFINDQNRTEFWAQQHIEEELQDKLQNVDQYLTTKIQEDGVFYKYFGNYVFHHYLQDGQNDKGWGCAYRSCMSVISWFRENGYVDKDKVKVPSIPEIQKMLIEMGDKEANFMNSSQWIGAFEVSFIIQKLIDIECKIIFLQDGADIRTKLDEFKSHFINEGTPIMFGGDQYAYSILGIDYNEDEGDAKFLILDPHYVGPDNFKNIVDKGGISWKKADLFLPNTFYNFCCPLRNKSLD